MSCKYKLQIMFLGLLLCSSCTINVKESVIIDGKTVEIEEILIPTGDFYITYPAKWEGNDKKHNIFEVKDPNSEELNMMEITLLTDNVENETVFKEVVETNIKALSSSLPDFKLIEEKEIKIDGTNAQKLSCTFKLEKKLLRSNFYYFQSNNKVFIVAFCSKIRDFNKYSKLYEKIIENIKITGN